MYPDDAIVGVLAVDGETPVYQCHVTRTLYSLRQPQRQYQSIRDVDLYEYAPPRLATNSRTRGN
jgi:hypothetical protein